MRVLKIICENGLWCVKYYVNTNWLSPSFYQTFTWTWNTLGMHACLLYRLEGQGKKMKYLQETYVAQWEAQALWMRSIWSTPWAASLVSKSLTRHLWQNIWPPPFDILTLSQSIYSLDLRASVKISASPFSILTSDCSNKSWMAGPLILPLQSQRRKPNIPAVVAFYLDPCRTS